MADRRRSFFWPTLAAVLLLGITIAAGNWQLARARYKAALNARIEERLAAPAVALTGREQNVSDLSFRRAWVVGRFDARYEIFVDNRTLAGGPAYQVLTPLVISGGDRAVLVDRGLVKREWQAREVKVPMPVGEVMLEGILTPPPGKYLELSSRVVQGKVWQNLDLPRYAAGLPYPLLPLVLVQTSDTGDGLYRQWRRPDAGVERHQGYAFQWFAMAAAVVVIYGVMYAKRRKRERTP
jgi:surfeit locus 1 family protein